FWGVPASAVTSRLCLGPCSVRSGFLSPLLPSVLPQPAGAVRLLRSAGVPPPHRYYEPSRRRLVFSRFPESPVIRPTWLHRLRDGTRTVSPVARHALVTVLPLTTPPE